MVKTRSVQASILEELLQLDLKLASFEDCTPDKTLD